MTIDVPFSIGDVACFSNATHIFNSGTVESIEAEIFVKVRSHETDDILVLKVEDLFTKQQTREYIQPVLARIDALEA